jgi:hypothetical protein
MFQGGVSAELLAQKERLKKKMQQQIRKTYKVGSHFHELLLPVFRIRIRDPVLFDHWIWIRVKFLPDLDPTHIF